MSRFPTEVVDRKLGELAPDFAPEPQGTRDDAQKLLRELESEMEDAVGQGNLEALRQDLRNFLGGLKGPSERRRTLLRSNFLTRLVSRPITA